jgi:hypothetical protein
MLIDPDGTRHYLGQSAAGDSSCSISGETTDGYHIKFSGYWGAFNVWYNDGTYIGFGRINNRLLGGGMIDTNGNYRGVAYKDASAGYAPSAIDYAVDTLGRVIQFNYDSSLQLVSITAQGLMEPARTLSPRRWLSSSSWLGP